MQKYHLYIVLTRTKTVLSRLIQFFTKGTYTHAALSLDRELKQMYSFGRKVPYNPVIGGFMQERIDRGLYKLQKTLPGIIMEIEVSKEQYDQANRIIDDFITSKHLYKYNYRGLIHSLFRQEVCYDKQFLCSEFVYYVLAEIGAIDLNIPRNLVRPHNFLDLNCKIIFEGNLKELRILCNKPRATKNNSWQILWSELTPLKELL
ncbi:MAG: hypothetical protein ACOX3R_10300 [Desulfitobacteriia bacterium]|jgi:hypothetical protein